MYKLLLLTACAILLSACGSSGQDETAKPAENVSVQVSDPTPATSLLFLDARPSEPIQVTAARAMQAGQAVTVQGRIGGREKPFIEGRSAFLLADLKAIAACDANPDDECKTPWDYCCETASKVASSTMLVQVVDKDGKVEPVSLNGAGGMKPGSFVVVTGTLSPKSTADNPILIAQSVFIDSAESAESAPAPQVKSP